MRSIYIYIIGFIVIATLGGCRSHKELQRSDSKPDTKPTVTTPVTEKPQPPRLDTIINVSYTSLTANFSCTVNDIKVNGQLRMYRDSIVWVSITKVVELGRARMTPQRVQAYAKLRGKSYDLGYGDISKRWGIDMDFATMQALLVGNCPPNCRKSKEPQRSGDTVTLWYNQNGDQRQLTLKKDFPSKRIVAAELQNKSLGQRLEMTYGGVQNVEGQMIPTTIGVKINSRSFNEQTTIYLERITLNKTESFPFKMPK